MAKMFASKTKCLLGGLSLLLLASCAPQNNKDSGYRFEYLYRDLPFEMPKIDVPIFPNNQVSITDFNAVGDGITINTKAFSDAFEALSQKGGGTLTVPQGIWFTGPIEFKSHINLHLAKGAVILFSPNFDDSPLVNTVFEGLDTKRCQ